MTSGTHQQPNTTSAQPNIILIHTTQTKIKNLVHWHTIEFSDNNHTTSHNHTKRCAAHSEWKVKNNLYIASGLFSYRHTHQNLKALSGALSVSLTHIKLHTHNHQHKSPAHSPKSGLGWGLFRCLMKLLDGFFLPALNCGA